MNATIEKKLTRLNVICRAIEDWQSGSINWAEARRRADETDEVWEAVSERISRYTGRAQLAGAVAAVIGL